MGEVWGGKKVKAGVEDGLPRVSRRVVALVIERITLPQRTEAPPEIVDQRPREERLLPAGA